MYRYIAIAALFSLCLVGCGSSESDKFLGVPDTDGGAPVKKEAQQAGRERMVRLDMPNEKAGEKQDRPAQQLERKIIYTGRIELIVDDFDKAEKALLEVITENKGYVANSEVSGQPNRPRQGSWTVRIPVDDREKFRDEAIKIGELRRSTLDSRDITDSYYDTQAAVKNLETREEGLRTMLKEKATGSKLDELLAVDRELNAVRGEINIRKGQIQRWNAETSLSTYTVTIYDRRGYIPPQSPEYSSQVARTFFGSLNAMVEMFKALGLALTAVLVWLPLIAVIVVPLWILIRRQLRKATSSAEAVHVVVVEEDSGK